MRVLLTGGSGRLGTELRTELSARGAEVFAPPRDELDITRKRTILETLGRYTPDVVVHAAYTEVAAAETRREECWASNVGETRNVILTLSKSEAKLAPHLDRLRVLG